MTVTKMNRKLFRAVTHLILVDVYLKTSRASCMKDFDPKLTEQLQNLTTQHMHVEHHYELAETEDGKPLLRIVMRFGIRWVSAEAEETLHVKALIEADFIAEYWMTEIFDLSCMDEFALKRTSYHVWPYWREFLNSQCERMRLPRVVLPSVQFSKPEEAKG